MGPWGEQLGRAVEGTAWTKEGTACRKEQLARRQEQLARPKEQLARTKEQLGRRVERTACLVPAFLGGRDVALVMLLD